MYTLYYSQGACSLATQVVLHELDQQVTLIDRQQVSNFAAINPVSAVPVLVEGEHTWTEGAAIILYLLQKHPSALLASDGPARQQTMQDIMFANATMHPAYGRLFFLAQNIVDEKAKQQGLNAAASAINQLWSNVEDRLADQVFLAGDRPGAADIMLAVYATWGQYFPVEINLGSRVKNMLEKVQAMPSFTRAVAAEQALSDAKS